MMDARLRRVCFARLLARKTVMTTPLITMLRESGASLRDTGCRQTARLMILAADEVERLDERIRQLEDELRVLPEHGPLPRAANRNTVVPFTAVMLRQRG